MKVILLTNTREHPMGQGSTVEVDDAEALLYPQIYRPVEAEDREKREAAARVEVNLAAQQAERTRVTLANVRYEVHRKIAQATYQRQQATEMDKLATEIERQAAESAAELARMEAEEPPVPDVPPAPPAAAAPPAATQPHKRGRAPFIGGVTEVRVP